MLLTCIRERNFLYLPFVICLEGLVLYLHLGQSRCWIWRKMPVFKGKVSLNLMYQHDRLKTTTNSLTFSHQEVGLCPFLWNLGGLCNCCNSLNTAEVTLCQISLLIFFFFFWVFCPCRATLEAYGDFQARGSNQSCSCWPKPEPQQCQIRAVSAIYTPAHGNARSLSS